jgi:predicted SAM-dependent methyltransferase
MIRNFKKPIRLNVGAGECPLPGFINIDERNVPGCTDILDNGMFLRRFKPNSVTEIYACAILEHWSRHLYHIALKRWYEILEPNGILRISVPDFRQVAKQYLEIGNLQEILGFCVGGGDYDSNFHKMIFDWETLSSDLRKVGFPIVRKYNWWEIEPYCHIDDFSQSYLPQVFDEEGNPTLKREAAHD